MIRHLTALLLVLLAGCGMTGSVRESGYSAEPSPGAKPASGLREGPWKEVSGGSWRAVFFDGPWQCNQRWMASCQRECALEGHTLKGCMWLADIKYDWRGQLVVPPIPVEAGTRYAIWHCCCDYTPLTPAANKAAREQWKNKTKSLRRDWGEKFGEWPRSGEEHWPGHHIRDLLHGGASTDLNNILPTPPTIHEVFNQQYPACYAGTAPWNTVGPDLPYTDR